MYALHYFSLFVAIVYSITIIARIPHIGKAGIKIHAGSVLFCALGWTVFIMTK